MANVQPRKETYNKFSSKDGSDRSAHYEIKNYNGFIRVKSLEFDTYFRRHSENNDYDMWIQDDSNDTTINNRDTLFKVENLGNNVIALRNIGNEKVCIRDSKTGLYDCLRAKESYVVNNAHLVVEEPVSSRKIEAQYKLEDAKVTSQTLRDVSTETAINKYEDRDDELSISFTYDKIRKTNWESTTTLRKNMKAEINISIPKIKGLDGKFELSNQLEEIEHLEKGSISSEKKEVRYTIKVPPKTKAILKGQVLEVTYDIPFSYIQTDVYTTGEKVTIVVEDGVCQGFEAYESTYEKEYIPL